MTQRLIIARCAAKSCRKPLSAPELYRCAECDLPYCHEHLNVHFATHSVDYASGEKLAQAFVDQSEQLEKSYAEIHTLTKRVFALENNSDWPSDTKDPQPLDSNFEEWFKAYLAASPVAPQGAEKPLCDTTMTPRNPANSCVCKHHTDQMGPCDTFMQGGNARCVYCNHEHLCHQPDVASDSVPEPTAGIDWTKDGTPGFDEMVVKAAEPTAIAAQRYRRTQRRAGWFYISANGRSLCSEGRSMNESEAWRDARLNYDSVIAYELTHNPKFSAPPEADEWLRKMAAAEDGAFVGVGTTPYNLACLDIIQASKKSVSTESDLQMQNVSVDDRRHTIVMPAIFRVSLRKSEDGWIVAEVPALPGCVSQGKDEREALENVKEAITAWMWAEDQKFCTPTETEKEPVPAEGGEQPSEQDVREAVRLCNSSGILVSGILAQYRVATLIQNQRLHEAQISKLTKDRDEAQELAAVRGEQIVNLRTFLSMSEYHFICHMETRAESAERRVDELEKQLEASQPAAAPAEGGSR